MSRHRPVGQQDQGARRWPSPPASGAAKTRPTPDFLPPQDHRAWTQDLFCLCLYRPTGARGGVSTHSRQLWPSRAACPGRSLRCAEETQAPL